MNWNGIVLNVRFFQNCFFWQVAVLLYLSNSNCSNRGLCWTLWLPWLFFVKALSLMSLFLLSRFIFSFLFNYLPFPLLASCRLFCHTSNLYLILFLVCHTLDTVKASPLVAFPSVIDLKCAFTTVSVEKLNAKLMCLEASICVDYSLSFQLSSEHY